jgi:hypothetical protein
LLKFIMLELLLKADPPMVALLLTSVLALIVAIAFGPTDYLGDMAKLQAPTVLSETLIVSAFARAVPRISWTKLLACEHKLTLTPLRAEMAICGRRWSNRELRLRSRATSARIAKLWLPARGCHWKSDCHGQAPIIRSSFALDLLDDHRIYEISAI